MDLTDATNIVLRDVPAPCRHSCPLFDLDLHIFGGVDLMGRPARAGKDSSKTQARKGDEEEKELVGGASELQISVGGVLVALTLERCWLAAAAVVVISTIT